MNFPNLKRLYRMGFCLLWLKPRSKAPIQSGWTKSEKPSWKEFKRLYRKGCNVGVRLGKVSETDFGFLAVFDVDIKSDAAHHKKEALEKLFELFPEARFAPCCLSGRGNGSRHYYVLVTSPQSGGELRARSTDLARVKMPSVPASKREREGLSQEDLDAGYRLRPAWEISLMSEGRQVVLPPSIHPDTARRYEWKRNPLEHDLPLLADSKGVGTALNEGGRASDPVRIKRYKFAEVEPDSLGLTDEQLAELKDGKDVLDRSATIFSHFLSLIKRGVSDDAILSLYSDRRFYLGDVAFDHAKTTNRHRAAYWLEKYTLAKAKSEVGSSPFDHQVIEVDADGSQTKVEFNQSGDWQRQLDLQTGPKGSPPSLRSTFKNLRLIFENEVSPSLLKRNSFSNEDHFDCDTPWGYAAGRKRSGNDDDALQVKTWLIEAYKLESSVTMINEVLNSIACQNAFHPVKDFLEGLEWDGVERVESSFERYLGVSMKREYLYPVTRKFFLALIARIYEPGCKFDFLPVFEGKQGKGKSSFGNILVGDDWFLDGLPELSDKDAALNLQGIWLCEMGELSALYRTQIETAKAFIARRIDKVRPPYGHRRVDFPRSSIFYGTTNSRDYLLDRTGNRRYWPIPIRRLDFGAFKRDRLQLLAEAKFMYDYAAEPLYLKGEPLRLAEAYQESRRVEDETDSMETRFHEWVKGKPEGVDLKSLKLEDLFDSGPFIKYPVTTSNRRMAGFVLRSLGYERVHTHNGKTWVKKKR